MVEGVDEFFTDDMKIGDDIYSMAFVSLIDQNELD